MQTGKVMIVDDEPQARRALRTALVSRGFEVTDARSGEEAMQNLRIESPGVILLDLKMPGIGGLETCRLIRETSEVPIVIVSARNAEQEKVEALENGADDFVTKPIGIDELIARIHAVTRRPSLGGHARIVSLGPIEVDLESHEVKRGEATIHLTAKEFRLLYYLLQNAGKVVSHRRILQAVWGPDYGNEVEYLRVFVNQLRKKIEPEPSHPRFLLTEPSSGYRFTLPARASGKS
ncbi:MAG TPA: response regulator transcription factor [Bryobacteraceae bacterium]|nr:response regulator transcription factor [Bryobacteraceae bacterium]